MRTSFDQLLEAGCHFGHLRRKWNPAMAPYIYTERNGIHIIDLMKTMQGIEEASEALKNIVASGRKVLFVATKKQAQDIVASKSKEMGMPYVTERWAGGMLTNFPTIRKAVKKMSVIDKMMQDGTFENISKHERLLITREREKLEKNLGSIVDLTRLPGALFVVDVMREKIAVAEANRLGIPVFGIVDTNSDPTKIDFVIPANDDATKSIEVIMNAVADAVIEGNNEKKMLKSEVDESQQEEVGEEGSEETRETEQRVRRQRIKKVPSRADAGKETKRQNHTESEVNESPDEENGEEVINLSKDN